MEGNIGLVMRVSIINIAEMQPWKRKNIPMFNGNIVFKMSTIKSSNHRRDKFLFKVSSPDDDKLMKHLGGFS